ncbi:HAD family hydrolase [Microlunatus soli]|uniref:Haloacid dehalogenase-like hydrolase n=1 Tax=Microlunatus soli TaxID=630515 RepID=A0A1H1M5T4_9ACTN|nr:HAD family hydrolase [Microlunatus soli]SDR82148.1 Haloacid dehalogenase-like hydrolase [Microlunatus soli]
MGRLIVGSRPEWIFFDVDQTLCDFDAMMRRALSGSIAEMERRWPTLTGRYRPEDLEAVRNTIAATYGDRPVPLVQVRRAMFAEVLADLADAAAIDQITDHYLAIRFADPVLFPDVIPVLEALQSELRLGVITNGNSKAALSAIYQA